MENPKECDNCKMKHPIWDIQGLAACQNELSKKKKTEKKLSQPREASAAQTAAEREQAIAAANKRRAKNKKN